MSALERHVVMFSGGIGSWAAARRVADLHGVQDLMLLFADTLMEDADLYRFLVEAAADVFGVALPDELRRQAAAVPEFEADRHGRRVRLLEVREALHEVVPGFVWIADGRDPWQVFEAERLLGSSRFDPCSRVLKRELCDRWLREHCDPASTCCYVGIDWSESHRFDAGDGRGLRPRRAADGWTYAAPLLDAPYLTKPEMLRLVESRGIRRPRLYKLGFEHNNCGGVCCKAGIGQYARLLRWLPERYRQAEALEAQLRTRLGDVAMLKDRAGGGLRPLPLAVLRERIEAGGQVDLFEIGGCGCFVDAAGVMEPAA